MNDGPGAPWGTGPPGDRRRYLVDDPEPLPGGQGFVFQARRTEPTEEVVSLKLLEDADDDVECRLRERWAAVAEHPHPRLATPLEVFRGPGLFRGDPPPDEECDLVYGVTRWVDGSPLRAAMPLDAEQVAVLAQDLAAAVTHLHETCGFVHRDIHPGNVIVGDDGHGTLIDLGAVRPDDGTATTTVAGVIGFIAPERVHGPGDRRTDVWGVGMVVAYALLGHPISGTPTHRWERDLDAVLPEDSDRHAVRRLIAAVTASDSAERPVDLERWARELTHALRNRPAAGRPRAVLAAAGVAALVAVAAVVAGLVTDRSGSDDERAGDDDAPTSAVADDPTAAETTVPGGDGGGAGAPLRCTAEIGEPAPDLDESGVDAVVAARAQLRELADGSCGTAPATPWVEMVHQTVTDGDSEEVIVTSAAGTARLTTAEWQSYREIAGRQRPENAVDYGGYIVRAASGSTLDGTAIELSQGGLVLGRRRDTQSFWMPEPVRDLWDSRGGAASLGYPMTNPFPGGPGLRQDFERGHLGLPATAVVDYHLVEPSDISVTIADDPAAELDGVEIEDHILRQPTASAWFVDDGQRRWISDGGTWECVGGEDAVAIDEIYGPALATLPLGPPMECES